MHTTISRLSALTLALSFALLLSSCVTMPTLPNPGYDPNPTPSPQPQPQPRPEPAPRIGWSLTSHGYSYDLDLVVNGRSYHVDNGGEHFNQHQTSVRSEGVSPRAISAYEIDGPDGEGVIYWVEQNDDELFIFSRQFDPYAGRYGREQRLRSIQL